MALDPMGYSEGSGVLTIEKNCRGDVGPSPLTIKIKTIMYYEVPVYKPILTISRGFSEDGRPYPIHDDDLSEVLSKSDFTETRRRRQ